MKHCPITYELISDNEDYSPQGLKLLSSQLKTLEPLNFSSIELRKEALARVGKMSVQGVQAKLSAILKVKQGCFELVDQFGKYILKPQSEYYPELPENEAITMTLATTIGIEIPIHGLAYTQDKHMAYFIKRFDRQGHNKKIAVEDFAQLSGHTSHTKYNSSMEQVAKIIENYCSFPRIEMAKLFKLTLFNFLIGNEDMHLKNFSLITRDNKIMLSPAYDLLNSTIAGSDKEELALPLNGKKNNLTKGDLLHYLPQRLQLNQNIITNVIEQFKLVLPRWQNLVNSSWLSKKMQKKYLALLTARYQRLDF